MIRYVRGNYFCSFFFQCEKSKIQHNYIDTILTSCTIFFLFFFDIFIFLLSLLKMRGTFFLTTVPQSTEKSERRKLFFSDFPTTTRACVGAFPFFSQHSTRSSLMLFFSSLAAWYYYFQLFFFFFLLPLTTFLSLSLRFSQTPSLALTHWLLSEKIFLIFTANNILLWYDNVKLYYNNSYRRL